MTILIVDDNEQNLYQLQVLLGANGYQVVTAAHGAEALAKARQNPPDLIISDILMPVMDGFALCREWQKDERLRPIPLIFCTATYTDDRDREFALSLGAQRFVVKPEEPEVFMRTVREVIQHVQRPPALSARAPIEAPQQEEAGYLKHYSEALIRKLEAKMQQVEQANRELARDISERKRTEEALREKEHLLSESQRIAHIGSWGYDLSGRISWSDETYRIYGVAADTFTPNAESFINLLHPDDRPGMQAWIAACLAGEKPGELEFRTILPDDTVRYFSGHGELICEAEGRPAHMAGTAQDITARKRAEAELRKVNRALRLISLFNQEMVRATDEMALLQTVCRLAVEHGCCLAWIGFAEQDEAKSVHPVAQAGFENGYLDTLNITWADAERGRGPTGTAIRTGQPVLARNISTDPTFGLWREAAIQRGYASFISLPLHGGDRCFGALNLYAAEPDAFDPDEVKLLGDLASDLAYGIGALRHRAERERAEAEAEQTAREWQITFDAANDAIWLLDKEQRVTRSNKTAERFFQRPCREFVGKHCWEIVHGTTDPIPECPIQRVRKSLRRESMELQVGERWFEVTCDPILDTAGQYAGAVHIISDITERKQVEEARRESEEKYRGLFERTRDAIMTLAPPSWRFTSGNPATVKMFGAKNEEDFISHAPWELSPERQPDGRASAEKAKEMIATAVREGSHFFKWTHRQIGGVEFPTDVLLTRVEHGGNVMLHATVRDITERKQAEEKIKIQLDELQRWHNAMIGREGRVLEVKREVNELLARLGEPPRYSSVAGESEP